MKRLRAACGMTAALFCLAASPAFAGKTAPTGSPPRTAIGAFIFGVNPGLAPDLADRYAEQAMSAARDARIDPCLLLAIVSVESHWKADAVSRHGAIGLGQLKPATAESVRANPFSPTENLQGTSRYLRMLLDRFKDGASGMSAIAAYNAGPGAVARNGGRAPNSAAASYVGKVLARLSEARRVVGAQFFLAAAPAPVPDADDAPVTTERAAAAKLARRMAPRRTTGRARDVDFWNLPDTTPALLTHSAGPSNRGAFLTPLRRVEP